VPANAESLAWLGYYLEHFGFERYDEVGNLNFTPLSSWITEFMSAAENTLARLHAAGGRIVGGRR
jgi:hypothetical protein